jgi:L-rhamnose mutarotase
MTMSQRYCFTLDLKDDPALIAEYKQHHKKIWPEILKSIHDAGINSMEIFLLGTRMFMIVDSGPGFSLQAKAAADAANEKVQQWEQLMWRYQQPLTLARPGEKWMQMEKIFDLKTQ